MQGHSFLPLLDRRTEGWRNEVYFEMSEFITGRGLRTPQYTYAAAAPRVPGWQAVASVEKYVEYMLYDLNADPYQQVNLAGRVPYQKIATELRAAAARPHARSERRARHNRSRLVPVFVGGPARPFRPTGAPPAGWHSSPPAARRRPVGQSAQCDQAVYDVVQS